MPNGNPGRGRPNRNLIWLIGVVVAAVVVIGLMMTSRGGDGRSGAQVEGQAGGPASASAGGGTGGSGAGG